MTAFLPEEHTLSVLVNNKIKAQLICTDADLEQLLIGYLYNGRLIEGLSDIQYIHISPDHSAAQIMLHTSPTMPESLVRSSGFGGEQLLIENPVVMRRVVERYSLPYIQTCVQAMEAQAVCYRKTGGMHCSALFNPTDQLGLFEDIGRHNTLDKLVGDCLKKELNTEDTLLITTGRISADMIYKAARLGASVVASYSTPTQAAMDIAIQQNVTLLGYLKREQQCIYSVSQRII